MNSIADIITEFYECFVDREDYVASLGLLSVMKNSLKRNAVAEGEEDLIKECERKLKEDLIKKIQKNCSECQMKIKVGDFSTFDSGVAHIIEYCKIFSALSELDNDGKSSNANAKGLQSMHQLQSSLPSNASSSTSASVTANNAVTVSLSKPVDLLFSLLKDNLAVHCHIAQNHLKNHINLQRSAGSLGKIESSEKDPYLGAIGIMLEKTHGMIALFFDLAHEINVDASLLRSCILQFDSIGAKYIVGVLDWFQRDKKMDHLLRRADELGGLTLPRAMKQQQNNANASTSASKGGDNGNQQSANRKEQSELKPLSEEEVQSLAGLLHELSFLLQYCENYMQYAGSLFVGPNGEKGIRLLSKDMDIKMVQFQGNYVKLEELWLTQSITIAVVRSEVHIYGEEENEDHEQDHGTFTPKIHSLVEDVYYVINNSYARAVNTGNKLAASATANHAVGFLSDGFFDILKDIISKCNPDSSLLIDSTTYLENCLTALNTIEQSLFLICDLKGTIERLFFARFFDNTTISMASSILVEAFEAQRKLYLNIAEKITQQFIVPGQYELLESEYFRPDGKGKVVYEMTNSLFEKQQRENPFATSFIPQILVKNIALKRCKEGSTEGNFALILKNDSIHLFRKIEACLNGMAFNELGALQLDADLRILIDTICSMMAHNIKLPTMVTTDNKMEQLEAQISTINQYEQEIRKAFLRLKQWSVLLKLENAQDVLTFRYPSPALNEQEVRNVLLHRSEKRLFDPKLIQNLDVSKHCISNAHQNSSSSSNATKQQ